MVDDEKGICFTLGTLLKKEGYLVDTAGNIVDAMALLQQYQYDLAFIDIMLADENGLDLLREIKRSAPATQVVMFTGCPQVESAAEAMRLGAFDYITKPVRFETLIVVTRHALGKKALSDERERYRANLDAIFRTVTDSIIMIDRDGCLAQFNPTAERVCGYHHDLIGNNAADLQLGCRGECRVALQDALVSKLPQELRHIECQTPAGKTRIVSLVVTPVFGLDGSISGAVAVVRDETELVEMELSLRLQGRFHGIVGASAQMLRLYNLVEILANYSTTVLINGESGTGKELVAAALHGSGSRSKMPFVKVNCSALSEHLLESELFGHVRGAFTGAIADKIGRFQTAHGGTLFLDEIGDISPAIQMRLLRVLQESEFERVGESTSIKVDVRIVAATNQSLAEKVRQGTFRQDLYYRLNVIRIDLPPLRERLDDLELLVAYFIAKFNDKLSKVVAAVSDDVMTFFRAYSWPGNVRELQHAIEHACIFSKTSIITVSDLPQDLLDNLPVPATAMGKHSNSSTASVAKLTLAEALAASDGNKARAARLLGISRMTLYRQMDGKSKS
ncbi:MAG: sigma-54-dependent Fis family transcriptional regulator [Deltaproteobacteria bacterium]|jgi:PAS domain S-box-containing protein|nr:sigma-54-dependent Fis family transcriptional regulator [Deltaproteobacteria bacterium]